MNLVSVVPTTTGHPKVFNTVFNMRLFLDTEFTQLNHEAKLISIALVDENEDYYYAELSDSYKEEDCSSFVKENVLPYLLKGKYSKSRSQVALELGNWIEDRAEKCIIANDAPTWDMPFLIGLIDFYWPNNLVRDKVNLLDIDQSVSNSIYKRDGLNVHNALHDALVMKRYVLPK